MTKHLKKVSIIFKPLRTELFFQHRTLWLAAAERMKLSKPVSKPSFLVTKLILHCFSMKVSQSLWAIKVNAKKHMSQGFFAYSKSAKEYAKNQKAKNWKIAMQK